MSPVATGRRRGAPRTSRASTAPTRRPLAASNTNREHMESDLRDIFNMSQHVTTTDQALTRLKKLYSTAKFRDFEKPFMDCLKKLLQSKQTIYFKTSCDFVCEFLLHVTTNLEDDRLIRSCADVTDHYMQLSQEDCRLNAVVFITRVLYQIQDLDEEICSALRKALPRRIRDKKPAIRAQAILASRKFQDDKMIQEAFVYHFNKDPELTVRKALVLSMETEIYGYDFLAESTQDEHQAIRKSAFLRLSKISPDDLSVDQMHQIMHNGLFERDRLASFSFKTNTLDPWLGKMYDGLDLTKLLSYFDVVNRQDDVAKLLALVFERDLDKIENNGTSTRLHHVVEGFRERWLSSNNKCLPALDNLDERVVAVWLSLFAFCKKNSKIIKPVKIRTIQSTAGDAESIEKILDSQEQNDEELVDLYERLTPDLVNLVDFLARYVRYVDKLLKNEPKAPIEAHEFVYNKLMGFMSSYEIGDELERKTVQEVLGSILSENLLIGKFSEFVPPIVKCLQKLIYPTSSNLMINYISELIQNTRSHIEDQETKFQYHENELVKCLQMYQACLESVRVSEVPPIMINHLTLLSFEALNSNFKNNARVRSLMVGCNGVTALLDRSCALGETIVALLISSLHELPRGSYEVRTVGFKSLVDLLCKHDDVEMPPGRVEKYLVNSLKEYGKFDPNNMRKDELDYVTCLVQGTMKLFYYKKLSSAEVLAHIILWWYHPRTHSRVTQFIGVALPVLIRDLSYKQRTLLSATTDEDEGDWLEELLAETFVTSIEYLCDYILGPGSSIMFEGDMKNLISFLCNLIPLSFHARVHDVIDKRIDDARGDAGELIRFLKLSKNSLSVAEATLLAQPLPTRDNDNSVMETDDPIAKPLNLFD